MAGELPEKYALRHKVRVDIITRISQDLVYFQNWFVQLGAITSTNASDIVDTQGLSNLQKANRLFQSFEAQLSSSEGKRKSRFEDFVAILAKEPATEDLAKRIIENYVEKVPAYRDTGRFRALVTPESDSPSENKPVSKAGGEKKKPRQEQWSTGQRVMVVVVGVAVVVLGVWYFYVYPAPNSVHETSRTTLSSDSQTGSGSTPANPPAVIPNNGIPAPTSLPPPVPYEAWMDTEPNDALLVLIQYSDSNNKEVEFRLIQEIQGKCSDLGTYLGIDRGTMDGIIAEHSGSGKFKRICSDILRTWKDRMSGKYDITWGGLLSALRDTGDLRGAASQLEKALAFYYKQTKQEL